MKSALLLLPIFLFLLAATSSADMYKWVDEHGVVTFKDTPPPKKKKRVKVKVYSDDGSASATTSTVNEQSSTPKTSKKSASKSPEKPRFTGTIEMYVTDWCPVCKSAEKYIAGKSYPYVKYDIEKDESAKRRYAELGGHGVPLILIGSKKMSGFSADLLEQYLGNE